jgi:hypothetical protein
VIIPQDWIDTIKENIQKSFRENTFLTNPTTEKLDENIKSVLELPINKEWHIPHFRDEKHREIFRTFFIDTMCHQLTPYYHPFTCGVGGGSHCNLIPRITDDGSPYLLCPTCGWIQYTHHLPCIYHR